jgi:hypothetical protein
MPQFGRQFLVFLLIPVMSLAWSSGWAQDDSVDRTAVLLFISGETIKDLVVPISDIRHVAIGNLHDNFLDKGQMILPAKAMDAAVGYWRVRDDWAVSGPFLEQLAEDLAVTRLQVVHLRAESSNLSLLARLIDCPSGQLLAADLVSVEITVPAGQDQEPGAMTWLADLATLCHSLDQVPTGSVANAPVLFLPAEAIGCESNRALTATVCVLKRLLAEKLWAVPDPALVNTTLRSSGVDPAKLGLQGRRLLQKTFGSDDLLRLSIVGYGEGNNKNSRTVIDDDPAAGPRQKFSHFDLILHRNSLQDGTVTSSQNIFSPGGTQIGWFGLTRDLFPLKRIDMAAEDLWQAFINHSKDH